MPRTFINRLQQKEKRLVRRRLRLGMRAPLRALGQEGRLTLRGHPRVMDGLSRWFLLLTRFVLPFSFLLGLGKEQRWVMRRSLLRVERVLRRRFLVSELLTFYVLFERVLMPLFVLVVVYGSRGRRIRAAYQFFLYTLGFSLCLLVSCVWLQGTYGTTDWRVLRRQTRTLSAFEEGRLFRALFARLAVKVPMMPVHLWLPEAHTEASTEGSVILAGVVLKLGTYGMLRYLFPLYPWARAQRAPLRMTLSALRVTRAALTCLRQADLKKLIRYSSVSHMGLMTLGLFRGTLCGQLGRTLSMMTHGVVSPALFFCVGFLYDRFGTRTLPVYGGLSTRMPLFRICWALAVFSNLAIPGTARFPGEFLTLLGRFQEAKLATRLSGLGMILTAAYGVRLYTLVLGGVLKPHRTARADLTRRERHVRLPFRVLMLRRGVRPGTILDGFEAVLVRG
uniref:NADH-ubiquinone oxidoreductase chain 4 n=1 Tax=Marsupiomonas sp. NIES 1824 TaxID=1562198 RepID=A0A6H0QZR8_9CHLO|nr:NADH dehydrogenase subunit 4 [Marsupiomonas sp. NIES 1824]